MEYWPYIVSGVCGVLLIVVTLALVFKPDFRKDLVAGQGKVSIGPFSVEGVVIVVLCTLFLGGLGYPVWKLDEIDEQTAELQQTIDRLETEAQEEEADMLERLPQIVESLDPAEDLSREIRELADESKGPWSRYAKSRDVLVSVPGGRRQAKVYGCPEFYEKRLELISTHRVGESVVRGEPVHVTVDGLMFSAADCRERVGFDLQLNCGDAVRLFSPRVVECDASNNPMWKVTDRLLQASAVEDLQEQESPAD